MLDQVSFLFNNLKDMTKTANITIALIRNVVAPIELYKKPPKVSPKILAKPPKLPAIPCTAPWSLDPARLDNMDMKEGHMRPLPTANNITATLTEIILFDTNKIKFVPKIMLPIMTNLSSENFFNALRNTGPWIKTIIPLNTA